MNDQIDNNDYTPEALAWKLIMDDNINNSNLIIFSEDNNKETVFEILLTIYIEMIFDYYKLKYLESLDSEDSDDNFDNFDNNFDNFKLDVSKINMFNLTNIFSSKFNKLKYILNVKEITSEEYEISRKQRYCTVFLKDSPHDYTYFIMNEKYLDPEKRYHFVLNSLYEKKENLYDIYCSFNINSTYFKIYFTNF
jgi:hypothetical protein